MIHSRPWKLSLPAVATLLAAACGGGGGGGGNTRLEGTITVPDLGIGSARAFSDATLDDVAWHAVPCGPAATAEATVLHDTVGGDDPRDVFEASLAAGEGVEVRTESAVRVEVYDAAQAILLGSVGPSQPLLIVATEAARIHVVVAAQGAPSAYRVTLRAAPGAPAAVRVPAVPVAGAPLGELLAGYIGADHEMVAGEVVVLHDEDAVGVAAAAVAPLTALGLVPTAPVPGPIQRWRVAAPVSPLVTSGMTAELQTALLAYRATQAEGVRAASPNYVYHAFQAPNDPLLRLQWHYGHINAQQAWALFSEAPFNGVPGSPNVIVAIVDTGMVLGHPDFAGRLIAGYDMVSDVSRSLDGDGIDPNPDDPGDNFGTGLPSSFHGTHVGGTVGAATNNGSGVAGMDWACKLMPIRVLGKGGSGTLDDIAQGIRFAAGLSNASGTVPAQRCDVMNMSLGGPGSSPVLQAACEAAAAAGVLLVAAAGNDNSSTPNFPASYDVCLSVGAIRFDYARAPYSNFANTVDVVAPGGDTTVDQNEDGQPDGVLSCLAAEQGGQRIVGFGFLQGTSMACPHVAGVAALVKAALVKAARPGATAGEIRTIITSTTFARGGSTGIVDAFAAVQQAFGTAAPHPILSIAPSNLGLPAGQTTATATLSNVGNPTRLVLDTPTITYTSGTGGWLNATLEGATAPNEPISHTTLRVTANRAGLQDGRYEATVTLTSATNPNVAPGMVQVTLFVGAEQSPDDTVYVLVVDEATISNRGQTETTAALAFTWSLVDVPPGRYLLVAGTDRDNDDFIGDEGELFGIWPSNDSPQVLTLTGNPSLLQGLDFSLQLQSVQLSTGAQGVLPPIRIRR
ncbi:MAG TPA: S8 family serine peptidase [Planctomycetota bacterium]|nr:S8 family serine peptidase [Planctomycetota bacterium]